jgi:hypothetical protein
VLLIVSLTILSSGLGLYYLSSHPYNSGAGKTISGVTCSSFSDDFTIIASQTGYNDSIGNGAPKKHWPILCVHAGQFVHITVKNIDSVEPHGFAVAHYNEGGITVIPGGVDTITFYANEKGDFQIFCNVLCAIHPFMLSGVLVVTN